jgi:hypothetical protein
MKYVYNPKKTLTLIIIAATIGSWTLLPALAAATVKTASTSAGTASSSSGSQSASSQAQQQQHLQNIISKGNAEINRRLTSLGQLSGQITSSAKLAAADQTALEAEVNSEISGLKSLQTQLDSETQLSNGIKDAQSIISDYRVYALILPKVWLIKTADNQQATEAKLSVFAQKLQTRLTAEQTAGKDATTLLTDLAAMNSDISSAQSISSSIEQSVVPLQPTDYDTNHSVLSGDAAQLKTAHANNVAAYNQAQAIVNGLESLK